MNSSKNYKSLKEILNTLNQSIDELEEGLLNVDQLESLLQDARELHERIAILQYMSILPQEKTENVKGVKEEKVVVEPKKSMNFQFSFGESEPVVAPTNQTNLLDAIQEEEVPSPNTPLMEAPILSPEVNKEPVLESSNEQEVEKEAQVESINDKFSEHSEQVSLADRLGKKPISDLVKSIGLNQKFLFMNDLFEGENNHYKEAINNLNNFASFIEADEYINTLRARHNWESSSNTVKEFLDLVERRYS